MLTFCDDRLMQIKELLLVDELKIVISKLIIFQCNIYFLAFIIIKKYRLSSDIFTTYYNLLWRVHVPLICEGTTWSMAWEKC
jgi:hypothetical protein